MQLGDSGFLEEPYVACKRAIKECGTLWRALVCPCVFFVLHKRNPQTKSKLPFSMFFHINQTVKPTGNHVGSSSKFETPCARCRGPFFEDSGSPGWETPEAGLCDPPFGLQGSTKQQSTRFVFCLFVCLFVCLLACLLVCLFSEGTLFSVV